MTTSAVSARRSSASRPPSVCRSRAIVRLLRPRVFHHRFSPSLDGPCPRAGSGRVGCSTLITVAPMSPRCIAAIGPANSVETSSTVSPSSAPMPHPPPSTPGIRWTARHRPRVRAGAASPRTPDAAPRRRSTSPTPRRHGPTPPLSMTNRLRPSLCSDSVQFQTSGARRWNPASAAASCHSSSVGSRPPAHAANSRARAKVTPVAGSRVRHPACAVLADRGEELRVLGRRHLAGRDAESRRAARRPAPASADRAIAAGAASTRPRTGRRRTCRSRAGGTAP